MKKKGCKSQGRVRQSIFGENPSVLEETKDNFREEMGMQNKQKRVQRLGNNKLKMGRMKKVSAIWSRADAGGRCRNEEKSSWEDIPRRGFESCASV